MEVGGFKIGKLPLPIKWADTASDLCRIVEQMLSLNRKAFVAKTDHEKTTLQRQIDGVDQQIDQLVYELYDLTDEEIRIVEGDRVLAKEQLDAAYSKIIIAILKSIMDLDIVKKPVGWVERSETQHYQEEISLVEYHPMGLHPS